MRLICSFISFALHAGAVLYLLFGPDVFTDSAPEQHVYMVELANAPKPRDRPVPCPIPQPPSRAPEQSPHARPAASSTSAPKSLESAQQQPTALPEKPQLSTPVERKYAADPPSEPDVVNISPRKLPRPPEPEHPSTQPSVRPNPNLSNSIVLHNEDKDMLKRGAELRFTLRRLASDDFSLADYAGHYTIGNNDRYLEVMADGGGGMLFFDSQTGLLRSLARKGAMIYTYGPAVGVDEPVSGSVTFFPVKHKEEYQASEKPGHLMWMPESPPVMHWGNRHRLEERQLHVQNMATPLFLPLGAGPWPGIVLVCGQDCEDMRLMTGFARSLAGHGIAVMLIAHRSCQEKEASSSPTEATNDVLAALKILRQQTVVDPARTGLWGHASGAATALTAAQQESPAFLIWDIPKNPKTDTVEILAALARKKTSIPQLVFIPETTASSEFDAVLSGQRHVRLIKTQAMPTSTTAQWLTHLSPILLRHATTWPPFLEAAP